MEFIKKNWYLLSFLVAIGIQWGVMTTQLSDKANKVDVMLNTQRIEVLMKLTQSFETIPTDIALLNQGMENLTTKVEDLKVEMRTNFDKFE